MSYWSIDEEWDYVGSIGLTQEQSTPWYPERADPSGPDVVLIMFDDLGFADLGCYGAEIPTPNVDALAHEGYRYNNFHTTTLCSPSRACLLTGRNHHSVGMRMLSNVDTGWPSGRGRITRKAALVSEVLRDAGWNTFAAGKWHVAPMEDASPGGPYDEWPLGRGFNRFYGFMNGATDHFHPELVSDNHHVDPPYGPEDGYHLTDDLIDTSCRFIADHIAHRPSGPFFLYLPLGAPHAPHQAPSSYMDKQRGRYDVGWDVIRRQRYERQLATGSIPSGTALPPSNPDVQPWDTLSGDERRVAARMQEAYAAFIEHTDAAVGRLFSFLKSVGRWDNTLVIVCSDNGAAMEGGDFGAFSRIQFFNDLDVDLDDVLGSLDAVGGPRADSHYARGWAQASNTPLKWYKYHTHGGGIRDPLIVRWGERLAAPRRVLNQFHHIIDIAPTIYEVAGVELPRQHRGVRQLPLHGTSLAYTFDDPDAPTRKQRQYFEMFGNRGIWADGWKAVTHHTKGDDYTSGEWELYDLGTDFSESTDLAADEPDRLRWLTDLWWHEAGRYGVLPLDDRSVELFRMGPAPTSPYARKRFDYYPPLSHIEPSAAPPLEQASYTIEAVVRGQTEGVILAYGNVASGFVLYLADGRLCYEYNAAGLPITAELEVPASARDTNLRVLFDFNLHDDRTGLGRLTAGSAVGEWFAFPRVLSFLALAGMDIGHDGLSPISDAYVAPFPFRGEIERVTFHLHESRGHRPLLDD